ncbi:MAG: hypothetical protein GY749_13180 [Desulfobacteraceae bacterium]|nr:hypothetical protein [Desulfobacteraceae bacterium]
MISYHYVNEKYKDTLYPKISKAIKEMAETGELQKLRDFYVKKYLEDVK